MASKAAWDALLTPQLIMGRHEKRSTELANDATKRA